MLIDDLKKIKSSRQELKKFGRGGGIFFLAILIIVLLWKREFHWQFFILSAAFGGSGCLAPILLKPIYLVWMPLATIIGWVITKIILSLLFFLTVIPVGLLGRLFKAKFLDLKIDPVAETYWIKKKAADFNKASYERQF